MGLHSEGQPSDSSAPLHDAWGHLHPAKTLKEFQLEHKDFITTKKFHSIIATNATFSKLQMCAHIEKRFPYSMYPSLPLSLDLQIHLAMHSFIWCSHGFLSRAHPYKMHTQAWLSSQTHGTYKQPSALPCTSMTYSQA